MKKKVTMIVNPDLFPISAGHHKAIYEICRYLHGKQGLMLKLIVLSRADLRDVEAYKKICDEVVHVRIPRSWGFWDVLNKVVIRLGRTVNCELGWSLGMRKLVRKECADADVVLMNYVLWHALLDNATLRDRTIVITLDIMFYRRQSFGRMRSLFERLMVSWDRWAELRMLKRFWRVCVLAEYEEALLKGGGIPEKQILRIGLPILMEGEISKKEKVEFDFITIGSNIYQNEEGVRCFFERVVPLLNGRVVTFAVAGSLSQNSMFNSGLVPNNVKVCKLGHVDDFSAVCSRALIGIGTVPYGSGIKVKIVEMIMNGLPVVVTNSGQEGIPVMEEGCINIDTASPDEASHKLKQWLDAPQMVIESGRRQGKLLRNLFSPSTCMIPLLKAIESKV